jgi:quercetin dioxygenase-like cupin family protein
MHTFTIGLQSYSFKNSYFDAQTAHGGDGVVLTSRVVQEPKFGCNFVDLVVLQPESSIGIHRHDIQDSEIYIIISGQGEMTLGGQVFEVSQGSVLINPPGGIHALRNIGDTFLKLVVLDIPT